MVLVVGLVEIKLVQLQSQWPGMSTDIPHQVVLVVGLVEIKLVQLQSQWPGMSTDIPLDQRPVEVKLI